MWKPESLAYSSRVYLPTFWQQVSDRTQTYPKFQKLQGYVPDPSSIFHFLTVSSNTQMYLFGVNNNCTLTARYIAWENSQCFARLPLEPSQNDLLVTNTETPYWWRALPRFWYCFWLVVPQGKFLSTNQEHYQDLGSACHQYGISAFVTHTSFCEGWSSNLAKPRLFSQGTCYNDQTM